MSAVARDTSIQIFDRYLAITLSDRDSNNVLNCGSHISKVAAVAVILGSKLHDANHVSMVRINKRNKHIA